MSLMNIAKIFVWFFFDHFINAWKEIMLMFWIENDSFWIIKTEYLKILKVFKKVKKVNFNL